VFGPIARAIAGSLGLLVLAGATATASDMPTFRVQLDGRQAILATTGDLQTGAWRVAVTDAAHRHRLVVMLARGDIVPSASLRFQVRSGAAWRTIRRVPIAAAVTGHGTVSACYRALHACFDSRTVHVPGGQAQRLVVGIRFAAAGAYVVSGATRHSTEAFVLDPWVTAPKVRLTVS